MESVRRIVVLAKKYLGQMTATHQLLIGAVLIVLVLTLFIASQYAGTPTMVDVLPAASATSQQLEAAEAHLATVGIKTVRNGNKLMVASADKPRAISSLGESGNLPNDKAIIFENILLKPSWTNSRQQNDQLYNNALQNELGLRIKDFKGVKDARVLLDIPDVTGFGNTMRKPSASASITTDSGAPLSQETVDAIAGFIAGCKSGLTIDRVRIIDASSGRQRKASNEDDAMPTTYLEHAARVETQTREKVLDLLSYIPGVVVAVTAHVDVTRSRAEVRTNMPEKQGTISLRKKETETTQNSNQGGSAAEPGFGANQTADINRGGGGVSNKSDTTSNTTEYENHVGTRTETIIDPKGHPTMVAVSVNVPRGFVVGLIKSAADAKSAAGAANAPAGGANGAASATPGDDEINTRFEQMKKDIVASLIPHVRAMTAMANSAMSADEVKQLVQESIGVSLIPIDVPVSMAAQQAGLMGGLSTVLGSGSSGSSGGALGTLLGGGLFDKAVLGVLSVAALAMMMMMVKKAGKREEMPTAEELVGLPPTLDTNSDVVGEADEGDTAMTGIEVGEQELQAQKVLEQVGDMVDQKPDAAAKLLNRWINAEP